MPYCPRCGYGFTVAEIPPEKVTLISGVQGCHTGNHQYHIWIPWAYGEVYDKQCFICGYEASWTSGGGVVLCDCCAQDWLEWNEKHGGLSGSGRGLRFVWMTEFHHFEEAQRVKLGK